MNTLAAILTKACKLLDTVEADIVSGGVLIDWHACEVFPCAWIDLVVVLRADSAPLYDRLKTRGYHEHKLQENIDAEIMEVILEEARSAFDAEIIVELPSNTLEDLDSNVDRVETWIYQWKTQHSTKTKPSVVSTELRPIQATPSARLAPCNDAR